MVARIVSKDMIKLDVVDLIVSLGLESLEYNLVLLRADLKFHCVKDGLEAGVCDEAALAAVFILEEGLDQEAVVADEPAEPGQTGVKDLLFGCGQQVLGVQDRRRLELLSLLQWVLLQVLHCEYFFNRFVKLNVVDLGRFVRYCIDFF